MKRNSDQTLEAQLLLEKSTSTNSTAAAAAAPPLNTMSGIYDAPVSAGADAESINKKARYVSEGVPQNMQNYIPSGMPNSMYAGMQNVGGGMFNIHDQQQQHLQQSDSTGQLSVSSTGMGQPLSPSFGASHVDPRRSFSGGNMMGNIPGGLAGLPAPASPYLNEQYAAMLSAGNGGNGAGQSGMFSPGMATPQSAAFMGGQSPMSAQGLFSPSAYGPNPAAMAAAGGGAFLSPHALGMMPPHAQQNATGRTVYVGNLPAEASVDELLSQVKFGPIENVRILPEKNCAFISFLDGNMAAAFHADASVKKMSLHNQELKIGWGKPSACPTPILMAVQQNQATRNVYLGQLDDETTEQTLRDDLSRFGPIDQVKIVRDKNIGFVHFLSIGTAIKVVSSLPSESAWSGKRVNYGKDRCAYVPKSQQQNQAHNSQAAAMGMAAAASLGYPTGYNPAAAAALSSGYGNIPSPGGNGGDEGRSPAAVASVFGPMANTAALQQMGNRTVYLGNIHPDTSTEEICNHIRGGILQNIRFIPEKHIAFITFIESNAALAFFHLASYSGIMIHQRRLKIGWGKHSGPLSPAIAMAVQAGGSRNVYIGNIEDFDLHTVEKLRADFGEYGETELVNTFREKNCAFVNFCNIQNAIKAIEAMKNHPDYANQRVGAGKDRCGNAPRAVTNTMNLGRSGSHSPNPAMDSSTFIGGTMDEPLSPPSMETDQSTTDFAHLTSGVRSGDQTGDTSVGGIVASEDDQIS